MSSFSRNRRTWPVPRLPPSQPTEFFNTGPANHKQQMDSSSNKNSPYSVVIQFPTSSPQIVSPRTRPSKVVVGPDTADKGAGTPDKVSNIV